MSTSTSKQTHVAVGVILDADKNILIALRPKDTHQGGLWEFPGGKVELGESVNQALSRELLEELGLQFESCRPLIEVCHDYSDKSVRLDVWWVERLSGDCLDQSEGKEGQSIQWVSAAALSEYSFPQANQAIIAAVQQHLLTAV